MSDPYAKINPKATQEARDKVPLMDELAREIPAQQMAILIAILNWATTWQAMAEGKCELNADTAYSMKMLWRGVGPNPHAWGQCAREVVPLLQNEIQQWEYDEEYRKANSMVWCFLKVAAPTLATLGKTYEAGGRVRTILAERYTAGDPIDVPTVSEISQRMEERIQRRQDTNNLSLTAPSTDGQPANILRSPGN